MTTPTVPVTKRKLIEVSLPLEAMNVESAREKSIRYGHPSTLHLWWARRPLATARAVLFAQLVDDPSSLPDEFPTLEAQSAERERLHDIIRRLVVWENINDEGLLKEAHAEILRSTGGNPPPILDPFAGGGTIPLEAQRLGLEAHASDLNPVAALINKALIEIPPKFAGRLPVFPGAAETKMGTWPRATGLAEDVRQYGAWMREQVEVRIGHLYPKATLADGSKATVIAWIWAHAVTCPNPACSAEVPLVSSTALATKGGREVWLTPVIAQGGVTFRVTHAGPRPASNKMGKGAKFTCWVCKSPITPDVIHAQLDVHEKPEPRMIAVVAEGKRQRIYLDPTSIHVESAKEGSLLAKNIRESDTYLKQETRGTFGGNAQGRRYGFFEFSDYFTDRQLITLSAFSDLVSTSREQILTDALAAGIPEGDRLESGGTGAAAYADAVATYLGMAVSRLTSTNSALCRWNSAASKESVSDTFGRQAISMVWDFAEGNPTCTGPCEFNWSVGWISRALDLVPASPEGTVRQSDAATHEYAGVLVSTDPPYYDNIVYSDLSDYFYVWLRRSLHQVHPKLFSTLLTPKAEELVANRYRHGDKKGASAFFEHGFENVFARAREGALDDYPVAVYYAFKQAELESEGVASTGWATLLEGMIRSGWTITGTWPVRSERSGRMISVGTNALASSIVLALRPRRITAEATSRRGFLAALKAELPKALRELQQGAVAPVDLAQATIGPGMAVFSRYNKVVEADGSSMTVKTALALINHALDEVLAEHDGDLDSDTRFCLTWYTQYGWSEQSFGEADVLARATNTSVEGLARGGVLTSKAGKVTLLAPADLDVSWDPLADDRISLWEATMHLARSLDAEGGETTARLMSAIGQRVELEAVQLLAYRLYELTQSSRTQDALLFNGLGTSWSDLTASARRADATPKSAQSTFDFDTIAGE